ncbi:isochorismatase family protein [Rossellomorea marisflavi]|uniref:isochorismatase family protein n=1 Tax=Rossellomorea marisflavi TaxID=189381 RepID=UPI0009E68EC2|nr:isochorismatase family protein [Rossellomorea marisflavi]
MEHCLACEKKMDEGVYHCSHDCTFCSECTESFKNVCPNCGGVLVPKVKRALLLIDVQQAFLHPKWGPRNNPQAEEEMLFVLNEWRRLGWEVIHIQHRSHHPGSVFHPSNDGFRFKEGFDPIPGETVLEKDVNSAFIGTGLEEHLRQLDVTEVVIAGLTTPHCISTSARMSGNLGFTTFVLSDATAAFDLVDPDGRTLDATLVHDVSLATLHGEFATVVKATDYVRALFPDNSGASLQCPLP